MRPGKKLYRETVLLMGCKYKVIWYVIVHKQILNYGAVYVTNKVKTHQANAVRPLKKKKNYVQNQTKELGISLLSMWLKIFNHTSQRHKVFSQCNSDFHSSSLVHNTPHQSIINSNSRHLQFRRCNIKKCNTCKSNKSVIDHKILSMYIYCVLLKEQCQKNRSVYGICFLEQEIIIIHAHIIH